MNAERALDIMNHGNEAQQHELADLIEHADGALKEEQKKVQSLTEELDNERIARSKMEADFRADFDRHALEIREATERYVRTHNQLVHIAEHMPTFVCDFLATYEPFQDSALTPEMVERRKAARELLRLLEPFAE